MGGGEALFLIFMHGGGLQNFFFMHGGVLTRSYFKHGRYFQIAPKILAASSFWHDLISPQTGNKSHKFRGIISK